MPDTMSLLGVAKNNGLAGLFWWAMDSKRRGRSLDPTTFTDDILSESLMSFEDNLRKKDNTSSLKLPRYQENCDFEEWYLRFQDFLSTQMGVRYTGLGYIIRSDMGATYDSDNDTQNLQEELDQSMLLTGNEFDIDNINSFTNLKAETTFTSAYIHIYH